METNKNIKALDELDSLTVSALNAQELNMAFGGYNTHDVKHMAKCIGAVLLTTLFGAAAGGVGYLTWKYHSTSVPVKERIQITKNILDTVKGAANKDHCMVQGYYGENIEFKTVKEGVTYGRYIEKYFRGNEIRYDASSLYNRLAHTYEFPPAEKGAKISGGIGGLAGLALGFYLNARKHASQAEPIVSA